MSIQVLDGAGALQTVQTLPAAGQAASASSLPVVIASDQSPVPTTPRPASTGGVSTYAADGGANALLTSAVVQVASGAHSLYGVALWNANSQDMWCQVFDALPANVTLGTTPPKLSWRIPGGSLTNAGAWEEKFNGEGRLAFSNAVSVACTTTATGSTAPTTGVQANFYFE